MGGRFGVGGLGDAGRYGMPDDTGCQLAHVGDAQPCVPWAPTTENIHHRLRSAIGQPGCKCVGEAIDRREREGVVLAREDRKARFRDGVVQRER